MPSRRLGDDAGLIVEQANLGRVDEMKRILDARIETFTEQSPRSECGSRHSEHARESLGKGRLRFVER